MNFREKRQKTTKNAFLPAKLEYRERGSDVSLYNDIATTLFLLSYCRIVASKKRYNTLLVVGEDVSLTRLALAILSVYIVFDERNITLTEVLFEINILLIKEQSLH